MIFPERVLGRSAAKIMSSGRAMAPIFLTTCSLSSAASPSLTGAMFAAGAMAAPLVLCGVLKIAYDLALFAAFRRAGRDLMRKSGDV